MGKIKERAKGRITSTSSQKPALKWQTGDYDKHLEHRFALPFQFLLLCKLMNVTPVQILTDFMDNLAGGTWKREGRDKAREKLVEYFVEHGYGQEIYSTEDIHCIFNEMNAIGMLFPKDAEQELIELHTQWREHYHAYWFKKWYKKFNREL